MNHAKFWMQLIVLLFNLGSFPDRHELKQIGFVNSSLTMYLKSMNKSMPIEKIRLDPFDSAPSPRVHRPRTRTERNKKYEPKPRQRMEPDTRTELDYIQSALSQKTVSDKELEYIRNSLSRETEPHPNSSSFQPTRKYFVPSLTFVRNHQ
jgi:primosomal protein N''